MSGPLLCKLFARLTSRIVRTIRRPLLHLQPTFQQQSARRRHHYPWTVWFHRLLTRHWTVGRLGLRGRYSEQTTQRPEENASGSSARSVATRSGSKKIWGSSVVSSSTTPAIRGHWWAARQTRRSGKSYLLAFR